MPPSPPTSSRASAFACPGLRWGLAVVLCLSTALNYFDRQSLALLAPTLQRELGISTVSYANILSAFLVIYTVMYAVSGRLVDRLGTRRAFALFVSGWSIGDLLHAFARTALQFSFCRIFLGAMEPANFPAGVKAVSEWFPLRERALAVGIFNAGTAIGACAAAPIVAWTTLHFGWRSVFVVGAVLSAVWVVLWLICLRPPAAHPWLGEAERRRIEADGSAAPGARAPVSLRHIAATREAWGCMLARVCMDPVSYFFIFWMPKFLQQERGFDLAAIGRYYWIPYLALAFGNLAGGAIPRQLARRGWSTNRARKTVMLTAAAAVASSFIAITRAPNPAMTVALISVAMFAFSTFGFVALPAEALDDRIVGAVTGFGGALGSLAGAVSMFAIGHWVTSTSSFAPVFLVYAFFPLLAFAAVNSCIPRLGGAAALSAESTVNQNEI